MQRGIKQGAVESPAFFAHIAEAVLEEATCKYSPKLFLGMAQEDLIHQLLSPMIL